MAYREQPAPIKSIYLDPQNPRHDPIEHEAEIISYLIENEQIKNLAKHIAETGSISPIEKIAVTEHPTRKGVLIAAEGNRRTCALKLLAEPEKANTTTNKAYFKNLASKMSKKIDKVDVVIFDTAEEARPWISLRHEGAQDGVGTKRWTTQQQTRFSQKSPTPRRNPNIQASQLVDYAKQNNLLPSETLEKASLTTLTRYLGNPVFRDAIGLRSKDSLKIDISTEDFNRVVTKFLSDATTSDSDVSSRTTAKDREKYAQKLRESESAPIARGLEERDLTPKENSAPQIQQETSLSRNTTTEATPPPKPRNNRNPDHRKKVIPSDFAATIRNKTLKRLYDELRTINPDDFPFAATYLFRSVIEHGVTQYLKDNGKSLKGQLHQRIVAAADALQAEGVNERVLKNLRTMASDSNNPLSPDSLGHTVHGGYTPTRTELIRHWDSIEAPLLEILKRLR